MAEVGIRALKQNASAVVAAAAAGEIITITDRGRPVAQLTPIPTSPLEAMRAAGRVREPTRSINDLPPPAEPEPGRPLPSEVLARMRDEERY